MWKLLLHGIRGTTKKLSDLLMFERLSTGSRYLTYVDSLVRLAAGDPLF